MVESRRERRTLVERKVKKFDVAVSAKVEVVK
jgi:hypothetical protein